jgi:hypothetical protein
MSTFGRAKGSKSLQIHCCAAPKENTKLPKALSYALEEPTQPTSRVILSSCCRHGSPTVKNAVRTARLAWHDTIVGKDVDKEFDEPIRSG